MPQPEAYGTPPSWDKQSSDQQSLDQQSLDQKSLDQKAFDQKSSEKEPLGPVGEAFSAREVTDVFRTLAAHGGGEASYDLALDIVLNEVVEQARLATGATGAAIALARAGEMVCRATTGADAPDLGVRFEMNSGLSGACLHTGAIQHCDDTETDPRVNAESCRQLGVRSILVLPLGEGSDPFGILEVFSARAYAFSDRDVNSLKVLARRVVENKQGAEAEEVSAAQPAGAFPLPDTPRAALDDAAPKSAASNSAALNPAASNLAASNPATSNSGSSSELESSVGPEQSLESDLESDAEVAEPEGSPRASNLWTSVLSVLVIVVAVLLGLALGWRGTILRGLRGGSQERAGAVPNGKTNRAGDAAGDQKTDQAATAQLVASARDDYGVPAAPSAATAAAPPEGGLLVTQNGKVIYRLPPSGPPTAAGTRARPATTEGSAEVSASRLIHRVEPQYPPDASARHIQGLVRLDVQIGEEGAVHNITVVDGDPVLAEAAVQAVRQWRYRPYSKDGHAVEMQTRVTIRFTLPPA